jgi:WD40 repeat protein
MISYSGQSLIDLRRWLIFIFCLAFTTGWTAGVSAQEIPVREDVATFIVEKSTEHLLWSKDGTRLVTWDGTTIQIWSPTDGLAASIVASGLLVDVVWNAQETMLLSWGRGETSVKVWDMQGHLLHELPHSGTVSAAEWCCNDQGIFTASRDAHFYLWNLDGTQRAHYFHDDSPNDAFQSWAWNKDYSELVTSLAFNNLSTPSELKLWNANGVLKATMNIPEHRGQIVWSPDGQYFLSHYSDTLYLWDKNGKFIKSLHHDPDGTIFGVTWKPTSEQILSWSADNTARLWNVKGDLQRIFLHPTTVESAKWSHDFKRLLTTSESGMSWVQTDGVSIASEYINTRTIWVWTAEGELISSINLPSALTEEYYQVPLAHAIWNKNETRIVSVTNDNVDICRMTGKECLFASWLWDETGKLIAMFPENNPMGAPIWIDDGRFLTWTIEGLVQLRDGETGTLLETIASPDSNRREIQVNAVLWNADLKSLLVWDTSGKVTIWKMN